LRTLNEPGGPRIHDNNQEGRESHKRDVKNEGTSGDVYENKGSYDTMSHNQDDLLTENNKFLAKSDDNRSAFGERMRQGAVIKAN
jgi:hypothetical protein